MKTKKTKRANLERKRILFFEIGLLLSLTIVLSSFSVSHRDTNSSKFGTINWDDDFSEEIINTFIKEEEKLELPKPIEKPPIIEELIIVDDNQKEDIIIIEELKDNEPLEFKIVETEPDIDKPEVLPWVEVEQKPEFIGGEKALFKFISQNVNYPEEALEYEIEGKIYVSFIIDTDGNVTQVEAINEVHPSLKKEAERVISLLPNWIPGSQRSIPVPVKFTIPINFTIF